MADVVVTAQYRSLISEAALAVHGFPFVSGAVLGSAVMGALIVTRDRRQVIGWLLIGVGTAGAFSLATEAYAVWVLDNDGPGTSAGAGVAGWLSSLFGGQLAITGMVFIFLLVPDGRFLSPTLARRRGRAVAGELLIAVGLLRVEPRHLRPDGAAGGRSGASRAADTVGFR